MKKGHFCQHFHLWCVKLFKYNKNQFIYSNKNNYVKTSHYKKGHFFENKKGQKGQFVSIWKYVLIFFVKVIIITS